MAIIWIIWGGNDRSWRWSFRWFRRWWKIRWLVRRYWKCRFFFFFAGVFRKQSSLKRNTIESIENKWRCRMGDTIFLIPSLVGRNICAIYQAIQFKKILSHSKNIIIFWKKNENAFSFFFQAQLSTFQAFSNFSSLNFSNFSGLNFSNFSCLNFSSFSCLNFSNFSSLNSDLKWSLAMWKIASSWVSSRSKSPLKFIKWIASFSVLHIQLLFFFSQPMDSNFWNISLG